MKSLFKLIIKFETRHVDVMNFENVRAQYELSGYREYGIGLEVYWIETGSEAAAINIAMNRFNESYKLYLTSLNSITTEVTKLVDMNTIIREV